MIEAEAPTFPLAEQTKVAEKTARESKVLEELMAHQEKVFLICLGFSRNPADAEDLTQEVYLKALKNIKSLTDLTLLKFWLYRVTRNTCLDFGRKRRLRRHSSLKPEHGQLESRTPESQLVSREQLMSLKAAIQQLPKKQREAFILKEYGDLSYQEIAETLKIKHGTVMSRLNRARKALKTWMNGESNEKNKTSNTKEVLEFTELIQKEKEDALLHFSKEDFRARLNRRIKEESKAPSSSVFWFRKTVIAAGTVLVLAILGWIAVQVLAPSPYERDARAIEKTLAQAFDTQEILLAQHISPVEPQPGPDNLHEFKWSLKRVVYSAQRENIDDSDVPGILSHVLQNTTLLREPEEEGPNGLNPENDFEENNSQNWLYKTQD